MTPMAWNTTILCVDDDRDILDLYSVLLAPGEPFGAGPNVRLPADRSRAAHPCQLEQDELSVRLLSVSSGEAAVELLQAEQHRGNRIAAAFVDMRMPGIDGFETIRRLREMDPELRCAIVTGGTDHTRAQLATLFSSPDEWLYIEKPFSDTQVVQAARHLIASWNLKHECEQALPQVRGARRCVPGKQPRL